MKAAIRRLSRLEKRFRPPVETKASRDRFERLEAGRRRVAEAIARGEIRDPFFNEPREDHSGLTAAEILHWGRDLARRRSLQLEHHNHEENPASIPAADPGNLPTVDTISNGHGPSEP